MRRRTKYPINQPVEPLILFPVIELTAKGMAQLSDPSATALRWVDAGATWLHVKVGSDELAAADRLAQVIGTLSERGVAVQLAGSGRSAPEIDLALGWGTQRVVLPPAAHSQPEIVREAIERHGAARIVGTLSPSETATPLLERAEQLQTLGLERVLYQDGPRSAGPNIALIGELAQKSGLSVIVESPISTLDQLLQLRWLHPFGIEGVLVGRALDEGRFTLAEARAALAEQLPSDARVR